ncbi:MAG: DNA/RNA nuclease SfsA [Candidatus Bathyarchaeia archaeon]
MPSGILMELIRIGPVERCEISRRVNRFVVEVIAGGRRLRALSTNTGRLEDLLVAGRGAICKPKWGGRTDCTLIAVEVHGRGLAIVDARVQALAFERAIEKGLIGWLWGCSIAKRGPRLGNSVLDYLLDCDGRGALLELKSAVLLHEGDKAGYPDCPTPRGRRQIEELMRYARNGGRGIVAFVAALSNVKAFKPYERGDPEMVRLLKEARCAGVEARALGMEGELVDGELRISLTNDDLPVLI